MPGTDDRTQVYWVWDQAKPKETNANAFTGMLSLETAISTDRKNRSSVRQTLDLFLCQGFRMAYSSVPGMWAVLGRWFI